MLGFGHKVCRVWMWRRHHDRLRAMEVGPQQQPVIAESIFHLQHSLRSMHPVITGHAGSVRRIAAGQNARRKSHGPGDVFLNFRETPVVINHGGMSVNGHRLFAREITACVQTVDPHIHQRTAPSQFPVGPPFIRPDVKSEGTLNGLNFA